MSQPCDNRDLQHFGVLVRQRRDAQGLNQHGLAERLKTSVRTLSRIENGRPTSSVLRRRVAEFLGIPWDDGGHPCDEYLAAEIPEPLAADLNYFPGIVRDWTKGFDGMSRGFVFDAVDAFLADQRINSGYFLITSEPGVGKTALIAEWTRRREGLLYHFNVASEGIDTARRFIGNICAQMIRRYRLSCPSVPPDYAKSSVFLSRMLQEAASRLKSDAKLVIAVDALDEVAHESSVTSANPLFLPMTLPNGVYFVVTSRDDPRVGLRASYVKHFPIDALGPENEEDVRTYVTGHLERKGIQAWCRRQRWSDSTFVKETVRSSEGNFMYLRHVLPAIEAGDFVEGRLPYGLREYYRLHWAQMRQRSGEPFGKTYEAVVCCLAAVGAPVSAKELAQWTRLPPSRVRLVLNEWRAFLRPARTRGGGLKWSIYHESFREFLAEEIDPQLRMHHGRIARSILRRVREHKRKSDR